MNSIVCIYLCISMSKFCTKIASVCLLFLFLFPQVQKGLHDFSHRNDSHCAATTEQHLHSLEHVCFICDFSVPVSDFTSVYCIQPEIINVLYEGFFNGDSEFFNDFKFQIDLRGPPFFAV